MEPAAAPEANPPEPPPPPGLARMLEDTLTAPFRLGALFSRLAQSPAPGYGVMAANLAVYVAAFFALNLLRAAIASPGALEAAATRSPAPAAVVGLVLVLAAVAASFVAAGFLHAAALAAGGRGGYARSYQITSLLSLMGPLQALLNWTPGLWAVPTVLAGCIAAVACRHLHACEPRRSWAVFGILAALAAGAQGYARVQVERVADRYRAVATQAAALNQAVSQLQALGAAPAAEGFAPPGAQPAAGAPRGSGLDLVSGPAGYPAPGQVPALSPAQARQVGQAGINMMASLMPMFNDPNMLKKLPPEQARIIKELTGLMGEVQGMSGQPLTPEQRVEMGRKAARVQQLANQMIQNLPRTMPASAAQTAASQPARTDAPTK